MAGKKSLQVCLKSNHVWRFSNTPLNVHFERLFEKTLLRNKSESNLRRIMFLKGLSPRVAARWITLSTSIKKKVCLRSRK
jgi:hypothetical protein